MPQIILKEKAAHLASYTFLKEMLIYIKIRHFHSFINYQQHLFCRTLITSYFCSVNIAKFLRKSLLQNTFRSSRLEMFSKIVVLFLSLFLKNLHAESQQLHKKRVQHMFFPVKFAKFSRNFSYRIPPVTTAAPLLAASVFF